MGRVGEVSDLVEDENRKEKDKVEGNGKADRSYEKGKRPTWVSGHP